MNSFKLVGLPLEPFSHLFGLSDAELAARNARRVFATAKPGYPCRVSLSDAEIGEELLLLPFEHQAANSPYRSSGPIFVRKAAVGVWHASCTCRMGADTDPMAVTDPAGRVRGVDGLRVVDASVFPAIPGFFIMTSVLMIAEKATDVILEEATAGKSRG